MTFRSGPMLEKTSNIDVWTSASVTEVNGNQRLDSITVKRGSSSEPHKIPATSLFIFIGALPRTEWLADVVERDDAAIGHRGVAVRPHGNDAGRLGAARLGLR